MELGCSAADLQTENTSVLAIPVEGVDWYHTTLIQQIRSKRKRGDMVNVFSRSGPRQPSEWCRGCLIVTSTVLGIPS